MLDSRGAIEPATRVRHFPDGSFQACRNPHGGVFNALGAPSGSSSSSSSNSSSSSSTTTTRDGCGGGNSPRAPQVPLACRAQAAQGFATQAVVARGDALAQSFAWLAVALWLGIFTLNAADWLGWFKNPIDAATRALLLPVPDALEFLIPYAPFVVWLPAAATLLPLLGFLFALKRLAAEVGTLAAACALGPLLALAFFSWRDHQALQQRTWQGSAQAWASVAGRVVEGLRLWNSALCRLTVGLAWGALCIFVLPLALGAALVAAVGALLQQVLSLNGLLGLAVLAALWQCFLGAGLWALGAWVCTSALGAALPLARSQAQATGLATLFFSPALCSLALARLQVQLDRGLGTAAGAAERPTLLGRALLTVLFVANEVTGAQLRALDSLLMFTPLGFVVGRQ